MNTITLTLNDEQINKLVEAWKEYKTLPPAYANYQLKVEKCTITVYQSKKVVFQGEDAQIYANPFGSASPTAQVSTSTPSFHRMAKQDHAGSDEVGTGDYFGPVCVCACSVKKEDLAWLVTLQVNDSKQISDELILNVAPQLMERLVHSLLILPPRKYNLIHQQCNMNQIKALLHNQAYLHLKEKMGSLPQALIVDQFTPESSYYRYLVKEKQIQTGIHFETKAESHYPAVACASMIARYAFLKSWQAMEEQYEMTFNKGAGSAVDETGKLFIQKYSLERLGEVAKVHFKNTEKIAGTK